MKIQDLKILIELCLSKCYFLWNNEIHELEDSGPIGLSLMVVMAEGFLQHLEKKATEIALRETPTLSLKTYRRYVDDSHARFADRPDAEKFKTILNQQHPKIQYTLDQENENQELEFLDVKIKNDGNGKYTFSVHRKEAITNIQLKPHSDHDPKILQGIFKGFVHRAFELCSTQNIDAELTFLRNIFEENGYEKEQLSKIISEVKEKKNQTVGTKEEEESSQGLVSLPWIPGLSPKLRKSFKKAGYKVVFKSGTNLATLLTSKNKTRLPNNSYPGVYQIKCEKHPNNPYIGQTKIQIRSRNKQHQESARKRQWENSGAAAHSKDCDGIQWGETTTLKRENKRFEREVREALEIQRHKSGPAAGGMNVDDGRYVKTQFWKPFFKFLRNSTGQRNVTSDTTSNLTSNANDNNAV